MGKIGYADLCDWVPEPIPPRRSFAIQDEGAAGSRDHIVAASGAPRIHGELLKLGIDVAQSTAAKYMARRGRSQTWKTFLHNHAQGIGAMGFLIVPTVGFRLQIGIAHV